MLGAHRPRRIRRMMRWGFVLGLAGPRRLGNGWMCPGHPRAVLDLTEERIGEEEDGLSLSPPASSSFPRRTGQIGPGNVL